MVYIYTILYTEAVSINRSIERLSAQSRSEFLARKIEYSMLPFVVYFYLLGEGEGWRRKCRLGLDTYQSLVNSVRKHLRG